MTERAYAELREQLAALERDAAVITEDLERAIAEASRCEQRAMEAVLRNDDREARAAIEQHRAHTDAAAVAAEELKLLESMQAACRRALGMPDNPVPE